MPDDQICEHIQGLTELREGDARQCEECVKIGGEWVHLRRCQTCGVTLCCDSSPNQHATKHYLSSKHPVMCSAEPGERWLWCYVHEQMVGY